LLALLVAALVDAQPRPVRAAPVAPAVRPLPPCPSVGTMPIAAQPAKKEPDKKEPDKKEAPKLPEIKWPTDVNGKSIGDVLKDVDSTDPTIREFAVGTLLLFGPPTQKENVSKVLLRRMRVETDPGVRFAVFRAVGQIPFENEADTKEALRLLANVVDTSATGGASRFHAVQTIAMFGPKGESCITALTGTAMKDTAYETRRNIALALGRVGSNERTGPNMKALTALADHFARDESAAVRMEALQSLLLLGPPWAEVHKPDDKTLPKVDTKSADVIIKYMKLRVGDPKAKTVGLEKDKQVEIWARLVLMAFDPKEINDDNLDAIARYLSGAEPGIRIQALQAMGLLGEKASRKITDVVRLLEEKEAPLAQTVASVQVLMAMGAGAKPAVPNLTKMLNEKKKALEAKKIDLAKKKDDLQLIGEVATLEETVKLLEAAIKHINEAKPMSPSTSSSDPTKKP
jgi:HEAT repeat protein